MSDRHPCFNRDAHGHCARIHLPVAGSCNIACGFCDRKYACLNESRPGVTARLLSPQEACELAVRAAEQIPQLSVAGIAGPGDPLASPEATFETLRLVHQSLPHLLLCLSSNGLALPDTAEEIAALGVRHMTVTVNAVVPAIGARICLHVQKGPGEILSGEDGARFLLHRQEEGVRRLKALGLRVKINTVVIPGINDAHVPTIAQRVADWGADLMNCIPLLPAAGTPLAHCGEPEQESMTQIRTTAETFIPQMRHCARCRADALGLLGTPTTLMDI